MPNDKKQALDWEGKPVPDDETDDTIITVWCVSPHFQTDSFDHCIVRSRVDLLNLVRDTADTVTYYDLDEEPTAESPLTIKMWLKKMTLGEYRDLPNDG